MQHEILYNPAFALARVMLDPGESIRAESGSMVSMSSSIEIKSGIAGGIGKALGRLLGGESIFQTTFVAERGAGEVLLAPSTVGDIVGLTLNGEAMMVASGNYLAGDANLQFETKASFKGFMAGEGLFMMRIFGHGPLLLSTFGAMHAVQLLPGQSYIVDSGHIVAFSDTMEFKARKAARTFLGSFTSGEGIVAVFTGPGLLYIQTRSPQNFASFLSRFTPAES